MSFPFHYQDTSDFCGPACLQMALENEGIPIAEMVQAALHSDIVQGTQLPPGAFYSAPDGVMNAANKRFQDKGHPLRYRVFEPTNPPGSQRDQEMTEEILAGLTGPKAPVFTLVQSGGHWITLHESQMRRGVRYFYARWPIFPHPGSVNLIHDTGCSLCGESPSTRLAEEELYDTLLPITDPGNGHWKGRTLLLSPFMQTAPAPPPPAPLAPVPAAPALPAAPPETAPGAVLGGASDGPPPGGVPKSTEATPRPGGAEKATVFADEERELRELLLDELTDLDELFEVHKGKLATATVGTPLCVHRRDRPGTHYYIVPVFCGEDHPCLLAQVTPCRRRLLRVEAKGAAPNPLWVYVLMVEDDLARQLAKSVTAATDGEYRLTGCLTWQPCDQSRTPFQPFHELTGPDGKPAWLDVYGQIHKELTDRRATANTA